MTAAQMVPSWKHDGVRALRLGLLFGIPITLPIAIVATRSGDFHPSRDGVLGFLLVTEAFGAMAAFRQPLPTVRRGIAAALILATVPFIGPIGLPVAAWLWGRWRAGLAALALLGLWAVIAFS